MGSVKISQKDLQQFLAGTNGPVWTDVYRRGNRVLNTARRLCPVDQGQLRASLSLEMRRSGDNPIARVGTNVEYAIYVHEGTGIYAGKGPIRPVRARVLRWPATNNSGRGRRRYRGGATGRYIYAKSVKGIKGRPFLRQALEQTS